MATSSNFYNFCLAIAICLILGFCGHANASVWELICQGQERRLENGHDLEKNRDKISIKIASTNEAVRLLIPMDEMKANDWIISDENIIISYRDEVREHHFFNGNWESTGMALRSDLKTENGRFSGDFALNNESRGGSLSSLTSLELDLHLGSFILRDVVTVFLEGIRVTISESSVLGQCRPNNHREQTP